MGSKVSLVLISLNIEEKLAGVQFYTQIKTITSNWNTAKRENLKAAMTMPTNKG